MARSNPALMERVAKRTRAILDDVAPVLGPFPDLCICGAPRWEHAGANHSGKHVPPAGTSFNGCKRWAADKIEELAWQAVNADGVKLLTTFRKHDRHLTPRNPMQPGQLSVRPSDTGACKRQVWYRNFPPEGYVPAPVDERKATIGTALHKSLLDAWAWAYPWRLIEHEVTLPGLDRKGRIDSYDPLTGVLDDVKTAGDWKWETLGADGPTEDTWDQGFIYGLALFRAGHDVRFIRLRYVHREAGKEEPFVRPFTEAAGRAALRNLTALASILDQYRQAEDDGDHELAAALIPAREGTSHKSFPCSFCPARLHCWNVTEAERAGRSPESWTVLGPDPETEAIEATLADYDAARSAERDGQAGPRKRPRHCSTASSTGHTGRWSMASTPSEPRRT